jgi:putative transposase
MPRIPRGLGGGGVVHVLSRGNARATVFHTGSEYSDFIGLLDEARTQYGVKLYAFCVLPNHFHMVLRTDCSRELSDLMQWWLTSHVRRHHKRHGSSGHVWQGRYKSFPIQEDSHLLTVLRYVLLNPCRAGLAAFPDEWKWSSLHFRQMLSVWPVPLPTKFQTWLAEPLEQDMAAKVKRSIRRGTPFGDVDWQARAVQQWGLWSTVRPRGRPSEESRDFGMSSPLPSLDG